MQERDMHKDCGVAHSGVFGDIDTVQALVDVLPVAFFVKDSESRFQLMNKACEAQWGVRFADLRGTNASQFFPAEQMERFIAKDREIFAAGRQVDYEETFWNAALGQNRLGHTFMKPVYDRSGKPLYLVCITLDITEQKNTDAELRIAATAFEVNVGIMVTGADSRILKVNKAFSELSGYSAEELRGKTPSILKSGRHDAAFYTEMWNSINRSGSWQGEIWDRRKNGESYPKWMSITAVKDEHGKVSNYVATHTDISERLAAQEEINQLAFYDPLTQLPNRRLLQDRLRQTIASSSRSGKAGALLLIDMDNFKTLNDTLGHEMGDQLLQLVASRLTGCVREGDTVARVGGDEFVMVLAELSAEPLEAASHTELIAEKILDSLSQPYQLGAHEFHSTTSIGATLFKDSNQDIAGLLQQADIAMYQAKRAGRNTMRFYDPRMQESISARVALESELRNALENRQLHLYYQIQVDQAYRPFGAEALIRWIHPQRGMVSPAQFIPLAEDTGLILPIGQWVLETACAQLKNWEQDSSTRELVLSVNVSAKQFRQNDFVAKLQETVQRHAINPERLKLELTESMLLDNIEETIATMNAINAIGISISLDDFGTGYSSLQYLKRLPLSQLKIDQSFVRDLVTDSSDKAIVSTIIAMARGLKLDVIAEGVETEEQRQFLSDHGCYHYQGYLFGKPMPITQFDPLLMEASKPAIFR